MNSRSSDAGLLFTSRGTSADSSEATFNRRAALRCGLAIGAGIGLVVPSDASAEAQATFLRLNPYWTEGARPLNLGKLTFQNLEKRFGLTGMDHVASAWSMARCSLCS
jgi:hypothetical protein